MKIEKEKYPATWIDDRTDIICPFCGQNYDLDIFNMAHGDKIMQFCPKCGSKIACERYFSDAINEEVMIYHA